MSEPLRAHRVFARPDLLFVDDEAPVIRLPVTAVPAPREPEPRVVAEEEDPDFGPARVVIAAARPLGQPPGGSGASAPVAMLPGAVAHLESVLGTNPARFRLDINSIAPSAVGERRAAPPGGEASGSARVPLRLEPSFAEPRLGPVGTGPSAQGSLNESYPGANPAPPPRFEGDTIEQVLGAAQPRGPGDLDARSRGVSSPHAPASVNLTAGNLGGSGPRADAGAVPWAPPPRLEPPRPGAGRDADARWGGASDAPRRPWSEPTPEPRRPSAELPSPRLPALDAVPGRGHPQGLPLALPATSRAGMLDLHNTGPGALGEGPMLAAAPPPAPVVETRPSAPKRQSSSGNLVIMGLSATLLLLIGLSWWTGALTPGALRAVIREWRADRAINPATASTVEAAPASGTAPTDPSAPSETKAETPGGEVVTETPAAKVGDEATKPATSVTTPAPSSTTSRPAKTVVPEEVTKESAILGDYMGRLIVDGPAGSVVYINNKKIGKLPEHRELDLKAGKYRIRVRPPSGKSFDSEFVVIAGRAAKIEVP